MPTIAFTRDHLVNHATADGAVTLCGSDVSSHGHDAGDFPVECRGCLHHLRELERPRLCVHGVPLRADATRCECRLCELAR